jgi:hypothetical protein
MGEADVMAARILGTLEVTFEAANEVMVGELERIVVGSVAVSLEEFSSQQMRTVLVTLEGASVATLTVKVRGG